jgi:hypothetical protein
MIVHVKSFDVEMEIKNKGVELEIRDTDGTFLGDLIVTKTQIIWCKGKTSREHGRKLTWQKFAAKMETDGEL